MKRMALSKLPPLAEYVPDLEENPVAR